MHYAISHIDVYLLNIAVIGLNYKFSWIVKVCITCMLVQVACVRQPWWWLQTLAIVNTDFCHTQSKWATCG